MNLKKPTLQGKIARLKINFVNQLPVRLEQAQQQIAVLRSDAAISPVALQELHRIFHSLNGTGKSFGFIDLADIAESAEHYMQGMVDLTLEGRPSEWLEVLSDFLKQLQEQAQVLLSADIDQSHTQTAPYFELSRPDAEMFQAHSPLVYICDDEPEQIQHLVHQLGFLGYNVEHFTDTGCFREAVLTKRPDAVIMDVFFPYGRTAGTDELVSIKEVTGYKLPAIVLSGRKVFEARLSAVRAGCAAYFVKPANPMDLAAALDELVGEKQQELLRILIVDDEPEVAEYHSLILEEAGMLVHQIYHPEKIFEALEVFSPDLMLVDMYMPVCNGAELAAIVRQIPEYVGLPIVFLSTETNAQKQFSAMEAGVDGFITKPVIPAELVSAVALRAERMRTLRGLMARDSLTGLYNHTTTTEILVSSLAHAVRQQEKLVMVMLDLDAFKNVNDTYGHMAGDQVIVALARLLKHRLRNTDVIGRYGGEEFALLLKDISSDTAEKLVNELREDFSKIIFNAGQQQFTCTFSAGISMYPSCNRAEELRMAADAALYQAKAKGRNQVVVSKMCDE